jgi:hypothetical protein
VNTWVGVCTSMALYLRERSDFWLCRQPAALSIPFYAEPPRMDAHEILMSILPADQTWGHSRAVPVQAR